MGKHSATPPDCPVCDGNGTVSVSLDNKRETVTCEVCKGTGKV